MAETNIVIYRMTHIENIPHILSNGITHGNSANSNMNYRNIGDLSLIDNRSQRAVYIDNGHHIDFNTERITLGDFIPFYFGVRMPMLYTAQIGGNFVETAVSPESIVYIACSMDNILQSNAVCYFSDGHATNNFTSFYNKSKIPQINSILDWNSIKTKYWGGQDNLDAKRKKQAEFLVLGDIKVNCIIGYGCYNSNAKSQLIGLGIEEDMIKVIPDKYF
ncbi:type II toxin-antitoxin system toxin DNA ADP-ribosyl transferase DarT [Myroides sp. LJL116]